MPGPDARRPAPGSAIPVAPVRSAIGTRQGRLDVGLVLGAMAVLAAVTALRLPVHYWSDEGISVGIAAQPAARIPGLLAHDGSPPLYYELLHVWMLAVGTSESATHLLSLIAAVLTVPVLWWTADQAAGRRTARIGVVLVAGCPLFLWYGAETRMYAVVALAATATAGALLRALDAPGRRASRGCLVAAVVGGATLAYLHDWGVYLVAALATAAWLRAWRRHDRRRAGVAAIFAAGVAVAYLPWVPTLFHQIRHTGAPWATPPSPGAVLHDPLSAAFGSSWIVVGAAAVALVAGASTACRRRSAADRDAQRTTPASPAAGGGERQEASGPGGSLTLLAVAVALTVAVGWLAGRAGGSWTPRYLAVVVGPLLIVGAAVLDRAASASAGALARAQAALSGRQARSAQTGTRRPRAAGIVAGMASIGVLAAGVAPVVRPGGHAPDMKSDVAALGALLRPRLRPGDVVIVDQASIVAVVEHYLDRGTLGALRYADPTGGVDATHLADAHLAGPDLAGPDLTEAHLAGPDLAGPDLTEAHLADPYLADPYMVDWDDLTARLRRARPAALVDGIVGMLAPGAHLFVVGPLRWPARAPNAYGALVALRARQVLAAARTAPFLTGAQVIGASLPGGAYAVRALELSRT